jgi:hypothetical protein
MPIRTDFPPAHLTDVGATCDGWEYTTRFAGSNLEHSYEMLRAFLQEEGYGDVPIPATVKELLMFKAPKRLRQFRLFDDNGYVHNPVKILFPVQGPHTRVLELRLYNEQATDHLLRFHGIISTKP